MSHENESVESRLCSAGMPAEKAKESSAQLKSWSPTLFPDLIELGQALMDGYSSEPVQRIIAAVVKLLSGVWTKKQ